MPALPPLSASELMMASDGSVYHLRMMPADVADTVILVGSAARVDLVKQHLLDAREIAHNREFRSAVGTYKGQRLTVLSHGIGCGCVDIVLNELDALANINLEARRINETKRSLRLVRIGTAGAITQHVHAGEAIITALAIGIDGLGWYYEAISELNDRFCASSFERHLSWPEELPTPYAVRTTPALVAKLSHLGHTGMTISAPGFFAPQSRTLRMPPRMSSLLHRGATFTYEQMGLLNMEMESASLTALATALGHETVTITLAIDNRKADTTLIDYQARMHQLIGTVLDAIVA